MTAARTAAHVSRSVPSAGQEPFVNDRARGRAE
jgi:hypothetical protein